MARCRFIHRAMQTAYIESSRIVIECIECTEEKTSVQFSENLRQQYISVPLAERRWLMRAEIRDGKLRRERVVVAVIGTYRLYGRYVRGRFLFPWFCCTVHGFPRSMGNEPDGKIKSREVNQPFYNERP